MIECRGEFSKSEYLSVNLVRFCTAKIAGGRLKPSDIVQQIQNSAHSQRRCQDAEMLLQERMGAAPTYSMKVRHRNIAVESCCTTRGLLGFYGQLGNATAVIVAIRSPSYTHRVASLVRQGDTSFGASMLVAHEMDNFQSLERSISTRCEVAAHMRIPTIRIDALFFLRHAVNCH